MAASNGLDRYRNDNLLFVNEKSFSLLHICIRLVYILQKTAELPACEGCSWTAYSMVSCDRFLTYSPPDEACSEPLMQNSQCLTSMSCITDPGTTLFFFPLAAFKSFRRIQR